MTPEFKDPPSEMKEAYLAPLTEGNAIIHAVGVIKDYPAYI